jgi:hypothetical protein
MEYGLLLVVEWTFGIAFLEIWPLQNGQLKEEKWTIE